MLSTPPLSVSPRQHRSSATYVTPYDLSIDRARGSAQPCQQPAFENISIQPVCLVSQELKIGRIIMQAISLGAARDSDGSTKPASTSQQPWLLEKWCLSMTKVSIAASEASVMFLLGSLSLIITTARLGIRGEATLLEGNGVEGLAVWLAGCSLHFVQKWLQSHYKNLTTQRRLFWGSNNAGHDD